MKRVILLACASVALAAAVACATSDDGPSVQPPGDPLPNPVSDGGIDASGDRDGAVPVVRTCSDDGWCTTPLPDRDLTLKDIWPFEGRAFAIAESETLGVKVLEWDVEGNTWKYIDDNTQNTYESGKYAGKIWAPNENEIYYAVAPSFIYRGTRTAPASPWSWQRTKLDDHSRDTDPQRDHGLARYSRPLGIQVDYPALGVWGTSADDVYAWYANTIFHRKIDDGGAPVWAAEYIADDAEILADTFFIFGASGSGRDDIWFGAGRARHNATGTFACPVVIHKTGAGYRRLVDNVINDANPNDHYQGVCQTKAGVLDFTFSFGIPGFPEFGYFTTPWPHAAWITNIESAGPGMAVGILGGSQFAYVSAEDGGAARLNYTFVNVPRRDPPTVLNSVWIHGTEAWLSGWGLVLRTNNNPAAWNTGLGLSEKDANDMDASTFDVSTTVLNGSPLDRPLYQVRGTSNTNLWAIGARYALHKTTP